MNIEIHPSPFLRNPNLDITFQETRDLKLYYITTDMLSTMDENHGVGLAGPQVGFNKNIFVTKFGIFINPRITKKSKSIIESWEGCLSIPETIGNNINIPRYKTIDLEYYDEYFNKFNKRFTDIEAIVIQHEYDHLLGKLIIDYGNIAY